MLLERGDESDVGRKGWYAERKLDGNRVIVIKDGQNVKIYTRSWKSELSPLFPEIIAEARKLSDGIYDGELAFINRKTHQDEFLTALATPELKKNYDVKLNLFDVLYHGDQNVERLPLEERKYILMDEVEERPFNHITLIPTVVEGQKEFLEQVREAGGEGLVMKRAGSPYVEDTRSKDWLKVKFWASDDVVVIGATQGKGARASTFGALLLGQYDSNGKLHYVGKTSGFTDDMLRRLNSEIKSKAVSRAPVQDRIPDVKYWVNPEIVIETKFMERTDDNKMRFPDFLRVRDDKSPRECKLPESSEES
jgi:bifunctional non-homologous end joining protein LigD